MQVSIVGERILFVDDEAAVLDGYRRNLHQEFSITTAMGAESGLEAVGSDGPFAVVISDMRMPGMNGAEFLSLVRERAPDTTRMLLTGHADIDTAIRAVNQGNIFRFLAKPCEKEALVQAIESGIALYRTVTAERDLIKKAQLLARSTSDWDATDLSEPEKFEDMAGLLGPPEARAYLEKLFGTDNQSHVVLLKLPLLPTIETRHGEDAAADYLNGVAQFIVNSFRSTDRLFQWTRDVLMIVVRRQMLAPAVRMEISRVMANAPAQIVYVEGKKVMIAVSCTFDLLSISKFSTLDEMLAAFSAKLIGI